MKNYLFPILLFFMISILISCGNSQENSEDITEPSQEEANLQNTTWEKTYGSSNGSISDIIECKDGTYMLAGSIDVKNKNKDVIIIKIDSNGDTLWTKTYGSKLDDFAFEILQCEDGNFLVAGKTYASEREDEYSLGDIDILALKINESGEIIWKKTYGFPNNYDEFHGVGETNDGSFVFACNAVTSGVGISTNIFKTDNMGEIIWEKQIQKFEHSELTSMEVLPDGSCIFLGNTNFETGIVTIVNETEGFAWVFRLDKDGNEVWNKTIGRKNSLNPEKINGGYYVNTYEICQSPNGSLCCTGLFRYGAGPSGLWIFQIDNNGEILIDSIYAKRDDDIVQSIFPCNDGGYLISGKREKKNKKGKAYIFKINKDCEIEWSESYTRNDYSNINKVIKTSDGHIITAGSCNYKKDKLRPWVMKLNESGKLEE